VQKARKATHGLSANPGGQNADTGSEDVDDGAEVGEGSDLVVAVGGTNSEDSGLRSGRDVGSVLGLVTGGNSEEETGSDGAGSRAVDAGGLGATKRHAADGTSLASSTGLLVVGSKVDASDDTRVGTRARGVEDLDGEEAGLLGDTVGLGANGTGAVGAVAVAIRGLAVTRVVLEPSSAWSESV
jgi:hypothetical protein